MGVLLEIKTLNAHAHLTEDFRNEIGILVDAIRAGFHAKSDRRMVFTCHVARSRSSIGNNSRILHSELCEWEYVSLFGSLIVFVVMKV